MSSYYLALPDEVVAETILWRLRVESVLQCRCVCKSWYSLITNPNFISTHLRKTLTTNSQIFMCRFYMANKTGNILLYFGGESLHLPLPLHLPDPSSIDIVGSVKGLICFSIFSHNNGGIVNLILCNPSIRHFLSIPPPLPGILRGSIRGFGFDETSQDYKILLIKCGTTDVFIYSLSSNCWKVISSPVLSSLTLQFSSVIFVNNRFHWLANETNSLFIMVFDLKDETFGQISLPECLVNNQKMHSLRIEEFGESSIAIIKLEVYMLDQSHIWVMKEYGSAESWMKLAAISEYVLGFINEDVLVRKIGCIGLRKINNSNNSESINQLEKVKKINNLLDKNLLLPTSVHKYVPSLVLLDKQNNVYVN